MKTEARTKRNRKDTGFFGKPFFSKEMFGTTTALFALLVILSVGIGAVSAEGPIWTAKSGWDAPAVGQGAAPAFVDLDDDGDYDLFIGEQFGVSFAYENTGSASSPNWTRNSSCDLPDVGMGSKPAFADLDNDGDYDVLIGEGPAAKAYAYENTGSASSPNWTANSSWDSPSLEWNGCKPALADLDNDGDYDLLLYAASVGNPSAYENTGSASSPNWTRKSSWDPPAMGQGATSDFADLDDDGDYDLLVGNKTGATSAYENTGSASSPNWTRKSSWDPPDVAGQSAKPALADLDDDGDYDLLIGEMSGFSRGYENTASYPGVSIFDTGFGTYPSIMGTHEGKIIPSCDINVSRLYTYPCAGTGGHAESIVISENGTPIANGTWSGYEGDWHNIIIHNVTCAPYVRLLEGHKYNYTIITGSYPQIIHEHEYKKAIGGTITCTEFTDANGKTYTDWIPAIRLE
jgi:hypothetical protein